MWIAEPVLVPPRPVPRHNSYPSICGVVVAELIAQLIVCLDAEGWLRVRDLRSGPGVAVLLAFDALSIDGEDLRAWSLVQRLTS
jgi:hypothetical protein